MDNRTLTAFREHLEELAATWYDGDEAKAFRHAAFQQIIDPNMADAQVIEATAIDQSGDLEIDGWFVDDTSETIILYQSAGGEGKALEAKVAKFWESPLEVLNPERIKGSPNESIKNVAQDLDHAIKNSYSVRLIFASRGGFAPAANRFARSKASSERIAKLTDSSSATFPCSLELLDEGDIAKKFEEYRAGFVGDSPDVILTLEPESNYVVEREGQKSLRATVAAAEVVKVFRSPGMGFRLFQTNPRGPLANARVNKRISATLDDPVRRKTFHLLNNGICAICDDFETSGDQVKASNFQIVNGCQTTVTLNSKADPEFKGLEETYVDLKLAVADAALAQDIAIASNSQTALRSRDYAAFETQQRILQHEFEELQPPWYYELKQGYWRFVLSSREKAKFLTGKRKRHVEVQPLAQASLAFLGYPSEALDRVRFVFDGIRNTEEREHYERAFPTGTKASQLLLPWQMLNYLERNSAGRKKFSTFHVIYLIASLLRSHYSVTNTTFFSQDMTLKLVGSIDEWIPDIARVADSACTVASQRAHYIMGLSEDFDPRAFFRASGELAKGVNPLELLTEAFDREIQIEASAQRDPTTKLPK